MLIQCRMCKRVFDVPLTPLQIERRKQGEFIQNVAPELSAAERELVISQTCGECFDRLFPPEDLEDFDGDNTASPFSLN